MKIAAALLVAAATLTLGGGTANADTQPTTTQPAVIAHAGEGHTGSEPLSGFIAARRAGATTIEGDVRFTAPSKTNRCGVAVVAHDAKIGGYVVAHHTATWWSKRGVATLSQVLAATNTPGANVQYVWELKTVPSACQLAYYVARINARHLASRWTVESFFPAALRAVQRSYPALRTALISSAFVDPTEARSYGTAFIPAAGLVTPEYVAALHAAGVTGVWPWTVNTQAGWVLMAQAGVDGVMTDHAPSMLAAEANHLL